MLFTQPALLQLIYQKIVIFRISLFAYVFLYLIHFFSHLLLLTVINFEKRRRIERKNINQRIKLV